MSRSLYDPGMCCGSASWRYPKSRVPVEHLSRNRNTTVLERTRIVLSSAPVARSLPSGLKRTLPMYRLSVLSAVSSLKTLCNHHNQRQGFHQPACAKETEPCLCASFCIKDLSRPNATRRQILAVRRKMDATNYTERTKTRH